MSLLTGRAGAQLYAGFTLDVGNRIADGPPAPDGLLKRPVMPSASVTLLMVNQIKNDWYLRYGTSVGSLGYSLKALYYDSTSSNHSGMYETFPSYGTFYISGNLAVGRHFRFDRGYVAVFVGGGLTFYRDWPEEGKFGKSPNVILFEYEMHRMDDKPKAFTEIDVQTNLGRRIVMGLRYRYHYNTALQGTYNFNQHKSSGQLSLAQRALSILFLVRITSR